MGNRRIPVPAQPARREPLLLFDRHLFVFVVFIVSLSLTVACVLQAIPLWFPEIFRELPVMYTGVDVEDKGIRLKRYKIPVNTLLNATMNPANADYWMWGPSGVYNFTACAPKNAPIFPSKPYALLLCVCLPLSVSASVSVSPSVSVASCAHWFSLLLCVQSLPGRGALATQRGDRNAA